SRAVLSPSSLPRGLSPGAVLPRPGFIFGSAMRSALSCFFLHCFCNTSELINGPDRFMAGPHFNWLSLPRKAGASSVVALAAVFSGIGGDHGLGFFYLLFGVVSFSIALAAAVRTCGLSLLS